MAKTDCFKVIWNRYNCYLKATHQETHRMDFFFVIHRSVQAIHASNTLFCLCIVRSSLVATYGKVYSTNAPQLDLDKYSLHLQVHMWKFCFKKLISRIIAINDINGILYNIPDSRPLAIFDNPQQFLIRKSN